jgi:hypothetical protein
MVIVAAIILFTLVPVVDSCCSAAQSSLAENEEPNWAPDTRLEDTSGDLNGDHSEQHIEEQIGYRPLSGTNVFMDLQQVIVHLRPHALLTSIDTQGRATPFKREINTI